MELDSYNGTVLDKSVTQRDAEAIVKCLLQAFPRDNGAAMKGYALWWRAQPQPRPKYAVCACLGPGDVVDAKRVKWFTVPEGDPALPIPWQLLTDPDSQCLVFVHVQFDKGRAAQGSSIHVIDLLLRPDSE